MQRLDEPKAEIAIAGPAYFGFEVIEAVKPQCHDCTNREVHAFRYAEAAASERHFDKQAIFAALFRTMEASRAAYCKALKLAYGKDRHCPWTFIGRPLRMAK